MIPQTEKTFIILHDGKVAVVPADSTVERSLENLREAGLKPVLVKSPDGTETKVEGKEAA